MSAVKEIKKPSQHTQERASHPSGSQAKTKPAKRKSKHKARADWHRLDNIGNYYASELGRPIQTVFRFSATMTEPVDEFALQGALNKTVKIFPNFNVCLRSGFFWHYLQEVTEPPRVTPENEPICARLHFGAKSPLLRISFFGERINFELSHMVSDGRGALAFFKELLRQYVKKRYNKRGIDAAYQGNAQAKSEDSYHKYYERVPGHATKLKSAYQIPGLKVMEDPTFMELHMPVKDVLTLSKKMGVTLTSLFIAVVITSIRREMKETQAGQIIRVGVPVDLRNAFESKTTKNFFGLIFVSHTVMPAEEEPSVELLAQEVQAYLKEGEKRENLKPRMMQMVAFEKNRILQFAPVFLKDKVIGIFDWFTRKDTTTAVSNVGAIKLDPQIEEHVKNINVLAGTSDMNFVLASCAGDLSIGISTVYTSMDILRHIVRYFTESGVAAYINSSKAELIEADGYLMTDKPDEKPQKIPEEHRAKARSADSEE